MADGEESAVLETDLEFMKKTAQKLNRNHCSNKYVPQAFNLTFRTALRYRGRNSVVGRRAAFPKHLFADRSRFCFLYLLATGIRRRP